MNLSISHRLGVGFVLMMILLGICGFAGVSGVQRLASSLLFVTGPAWQAGSSGMQNAMNAQGEIFKTQQVLLNNISMEQGLNEIKKLQTESDQSFTSIQNSGLVQEQALKQAKNLQDQYHRHQSETLQLFQTIQDQRKQLGKVTDTLLENLVVAQEDTMILMDENYSNRLYVEKLEDIEMVMSEVHTGILSGNYSLQQILDGGDIERKLQLMSEQTNQLKPAFQRMIVMMQNVNMTDQIESFGEEFDQLIKLYSDVVENHLKFVQVSKQATAVSLNLLQKLDEVRKSAEGALTQEVLLSEKLVTQSNAMIWSAIGLGYLAALGAMFVTFMTVVRPIRNVAESLDQIGAGEGDLNVKLPESGAVELRKIALGFNLFVGKIRGTVTGVASAVNELGSAAGELKSISTEASEYITTQQQQTEQAVVAIREMASSTGEIAESASSAAKAAGSADNSSKQGQMEVDQMIEAIKNQVVQLKDTSNAMVKLSEDSQKIGNVLSVIDDIAEQTNLLALNAAIEAARAGDKGRGFAVVADEVRTLASNTQSATTEIQTVISQLQSAAENAVGSVKATLDIAENNVLQAQQAGGALSEITQSADTISSMNTHIASAASQQSSLAANINRNIEEINQQAKETNMASHRINNSTNGLADLAVSLEALVGEFKY